MKTPRDLKKRLAAIDEHFETVYPYLLADEERKLAGRSRDTEFVYGITPPRAMIEMLVSAGAGPDDVYYDLGCGAGHAVLAAAILCGRAVGIELLPGLVKAARLAARALGYPNAEFRKADVFKSDCRDGTLFYSYASTCFGDLSLEKMGQVVARAAPGARIFTVTSALPHPRIKVVSSKDWLWYRQEDGERDTRLVHRQLLLPEPGTRKKVKPAAPKRAVAKRAARGSQ